jgi:hypothetical protein
LKEIIKTDKTKVLLTKVKVRTKKDISKGATAGSLAVGKSIASASNKVSSVLNSVSVTAARIAKKNQIRTIVVDPRTAVANVKLKKINPALIKQLNPCYAMMSPRHLVLNKPQRISLIARPILN